MTQVEHTVPPAPGDIQHLTGMTQALDWGVLIGGGGVEGGGRGGEGRVGGVGSEGRGSHRRGCT